MEEPLKLSTSFLMKNGSLPARRRVKKGWALLRFFLALGLVSGAAGYAFAGAEVKLDSSDGSTGFIVRNSAAAAVFSVDSGGNAVVAGTAAVAGAAFTLGGSTFVVKDGRVGIGTAAPSTALDVAGAVRVGSGANGLAPPAAGIAGAIIYSTAAGRAYISNGTAWKPLSGAPPPAPAAGGAWLLVPGDPALGSRDFWVQKYEAKNVGGVPTAQAAGLPWVSVTQTGAKTACEALGPGYHLLTLPEALTISRNIENNAWNWDGGAVGIGGLWRGHGDGTPNNSLEADVTGDPDDDYYIGTGNVTPSIERRVHQISSTQYIWDWSGNVWEWLDMTCTAGTGSGYWYNSSVEWSDANLSDYEKVRAGPAGAYTSAQNAGMYFGCTATGNAVLRGGRWISGAGSGVFTFNAGLAPSSWDAGIGFRCGR